MPKFDIDCLTPGEVKQMLDAYEVLVDAMMASNNTLIEKLAALDVTTADQMKIVNDWSLFCNGLQKAHVLELEKAASKLH
jgi:hypothetical protein